MRKYAWCWAILTVATVVAASGMSAYASRYPDSTVGCLTRKVYTFATVYNPLFHVGRAAAQRLASSGTGCSNGACVSVEAESADAGAAEEAECGDLVPSNEACEPIQLRLSRPPIIIQEEEEFRGGGDLITPSWPPLAGQREIEVPDGGTVIIGGLGAIPLSAQRPEDGGFSSGKGSLPVSGQRTVELIEEVPATMPPAIDDTVIVPRLYGTEPAPASDNTEAGFFRSFLEWWKGFFNDQTGKTEELPIQEESEYRPGYPPNLKHDPHYHHQYPGCPYTGCPYTGRSSTPIMEVLPKTEPVKTKKGKKSAELIDSPQVEDKESKTSPPEVKSGKPVIRWFGWRIGDFWPGRADVDTTEFRRSDAKPTERTPIPY